MAIACVCACKGNACGRVFVAFILKFIQIISFVLSSLYCHPNCHQRQQDMQIVFVVCVVDVVVIEVMIIL